MHQTDDSKTHPENKPTRPWWVRWGVVVLAIILIPFLFYRVTSNRRMLVRVDPASAVEPTAAIESADLAIGGGDDNANLSRAQNQASPRRELRLAIWNIAHGRGDIDSNWQQGKDAKRNRVTEIAAAISKFNADVVVLNEVDFQSSWSGGVDQAELIARSAEYPICIKQANLDFGFLWGRWYFGNVILSRFPISDQQIVPLRPLNEWESWLVGQKRGVSCTVNLPSGEKVSLVGLHLESRGETIRTKQVDDVARHCGTLSHPLIVGGDLNTTPSHFPNAQFDRDGVNAFDKLIQQTQFSRFRRDADPPEAMTFSTRDPRLAIDWILVGPELNLVNVEVIPSSLSDHRPVIATIELK